MAVDNEILLTIKAETDKARKEVKELKLAIDKLASSSDGSAKSFHGQETALKNIEQKTKSLTSSLKSLVGVYASFQGAKAFINSMSEIEQGFIGIAKTTGATEEEMEKFKDGIYALADELSGIEVNELQSIAEGAGQLGVAKEDILKFSESIAKISVATNLTAEEASSDFAVIANVFKEPVDNIENLGSAVNELSATTAGTVSYIVDSTKRLAPVGSSFGLLSHEVMAFSATLADAGIRSEVGATALSQIFQKMQVDVDKFAKLSGMSIDDFSTIMRDKPAEAVKIVASAIHQLGTEAPSALDSLGLSGAGTAQTILALSNNVDNLSKNLQTSKKAFEENTSVSDEYLKASNSIDAKMKDVKTSFVLLSRELMVELQPAVKDALDGINEFIRSIDSKAIGEFAGDLVDGAKSVATFASENKTLLKTIAEVAIAFIGFNKAKTAFFGLFSSQSIQIIEHFSAKGQGLSKTIDIMVRGFSKFGKTVLGLVTANPILAGLAVAITAVVYAYNKLSEAEAEREKVSEGFRDSAKNGIAVLEEYSQHLDENKNLYFKSIEEQKKYVKSIDETILANKNQIKSMEDLDHDRYAEEISQLTKQNEVLVLTKEKVVSVTAEEIKAMNEAIATSKAEEASKASLIKAHQDFVDKAIEANEKRLSKEKETIELLRDKESQLYVDLAELEKELAETRQKYSNQRIVVTDELNDKIRKLNELDATETQKSVNSKILAEQKYAQVRENISKGNIELAKKYLSEYDSLVEQNFNTEYARAQDSTYKKMQLVDEYKEALANSAQFSIEMIDLEEQKEIKAHNTKIEAKQIEIRATQAQIQLQMRMIELIGKMVEKATGTKFEMQFDDFEQDVKDADKLLDELESQKRTATIRAKAETGDADISLNRTVQIGSQTVEMKQIADNSDAVSKIDDVVRKAEDSNPKIFTYVDNTTADGQIVRFIEDVNGKYATVSVDAKDDNAQKKLDVLMLDILGREGYVSVGVNSENVTPALDDIEKKITTTEGTVKVYGNADNFYEVVNKATSDIEETIAKKKVGFVKSKDQETLAVEKAIKSLNSDTTSTHKVKEDKPSFDSLKATKREISKDTESIHRIIFDQNNLADIYTILSDIRMDTQSIHTIILRTVDQRTHAYKTGGEVIPKFATGGFTRLSGALGGYGGGDRIKALLEAGEFIHNKESVSMYGLDFMNMINKKLLPVDAVRNLVGGGVRRYATGGEVSAIPLSSPTMSAPAIINLTVAGRTFQVMSDKDVADALARHIELTGGI